MEILIQNDPTKNIFNGLVPSNVQMRKMAQQMNMKYSQFMQKQFCCPGSSGFKIVEIAGAPMKMLSGF